MSPLAAGTQGRACPEGPTCGGGGRNTPWAASQGRHTGAHGSTAVPLFEERDGHWQKAARLRDQTRSWVSGVYSGTRRWAKDPRQRYWRQGRQLGWAGPAEERKRSRHRGACSPSADKSLQSLFCNFWEHWSRRGTGPQPCAGKTDPSEGFVAEEAEEEACQWMWSLRPGGQGAASLRGKHVRASVPSCLGGGAGRGGGECNKAFRKEKHNTKIQVKYGLCKCSFFFQRLCRKVPPLLYFLCMSTSPLFLIRDWVKDMVKTASDAQR